MDTHTIPDDLDHYTSLFVRKFLLEFRKFLRSKTDLQVTNSVYTMLSVMRRDGLTKSSDLADALQITLPAVTSLSNTLVANGYIERVKSEEDRRLVLLKITIKGIRLLDTLDKEIIGILRKFWGVLSEEEINQLTIIFRKITHENSL